MTILSILALVTLASGQIRRRPDPYTDTSLVAAQEPAHTGDLTNSAGSLAMLVNSIHDTVTSVNNAASPYSVVATDSYPARGATAGAVLINLPATSGSGRQITIKKLDSTANACTPTRAGSDTIDAANTVPIAAQYAAVKLVDRVAGSWDRAPCESVGRGGGRGHRQTTLYAILVLPASALQGTRLELTVLNAKPLPVLSMRATTLLVARWRQPG